MEIGDYYDHISDKKLGILKDLLKYRAMTTLQIENKYSPDSHDYCMKLLYQLRQSKYIASETYRGSRKGKKGMSYHRLAQAGLECLARNGVNVDVTLEAVYVKPSRLYYLLMTNDISLILEMGGWSVSNSRVTKKRHNLDDRSIIQGELTNPSGAKFGFYVLGNSAQVTTIGLIQAEIRANYAQLHDCIVFAKGKAAYESFVKKAFYPSNKRVNGEWVKQMPLYTGYDIQIIPSSLLVDRLAKYPTDKSWITALSKSFQFELVSLGVTEKRQTFSTIIRYQGEEMYFADLTTTNHKQ